MTTLSALPVEATLPPKVQLPTTVLASADPQDRPDAKREALVRMEKKWELPDLLLGRTAAMHEAGAEVLVREQDESDEEFARRMSRTVLTDYYGETLARHSGKPFAKEIVFDPPLPDRLRHLEANADGCGRSFTVFFREVLFQGMHRGLCHVLVDVPRGAGETHQDVLKRKPLLHRIDAPCLLGVEEQAAEDGDHVTYARFRQNRVERSGTFGEKSIDLIMVLATEAGAGGQVGTYELQQTGDWKMTESPSEYSRDAIPLFTFYSQQTGSHEGEPAYGRLAELNLLHFQSDADQRHALSYGRRATVVQTGWKKNQSPAEAVAQGKIAANQKTALGYGRVLRHDSPEASASLLETSGEPIKAGAEDLKSIEERMERFGAAQISKGGGITATSRKLDKQSDTCNLEAWCTRLEGVALQCVRAAAEFVDVKLPANQRILIDRSFADDAPPSEDVPHILTMARDRILSIRTALAEMKARNVLLTVRDPDAEVALLAEESEKLGLAGLEGLASKIAAERPGAAGGGGDGAGGESNGTSGA